MIERTANYERATTDRQILNILQSLSPSKALSLIMAERGGGGGEEEVATCEAGYSSHICNVAA